MDGPPVVFIHSLGTRRQDWNAVLPEFAAGRHVFALDLRGHGESGRVPGGYRFTEYARDIVPFLRERVGAPASLVGHSLGGVVATVVAVENPELVTCVAAADPPLFARRRTDDRTVYRDRFRRAHDLAGSGMTEAELFATLQRRTPDRPEAVGRALAGNLANLDPDVFTLALRDGSQIDFDGDELVARLERPLLLIQADASNGPALSEEDARRAIADNTLVSRAVIEGSGHEIHRTHRDRFVETVRHFIDGR